MRIARSVASLLLISGIFLLPLSASAQSAETIHFFSEEIGVNADGTIDVTEHITYDFGVNERHGIYRDIPKTYTDAAGANRALAFSDVEVTDETGQPYQMQLSDIGNSYRIKIGDPAQTLHGVHVYKIHYRVAGAILYTRDFDELYWNVTGNGWQVPIEQVHVDVAMPEVAAITQHACYQGPLGSKDPCDKTTYLSPTEGGDNHIQFESEQTLLAGSGFTVGIGVGKGVITQTTPLPKEASMEGLFVIPSAWELPLGIALPIITLILSIYTWYRIGRDPTEGTVIAEYDPPPGLSLLEMAALLNPAGLFKQIPAAILSLAAQGAFTIEQIETETFIFFHKKDYRLIETGGEDVLSEQVDKEVFRALFENSGVETGPSRSLLVSNIDRREMSLAIRGVTKIVSESVVTKNLYTRNPVLSSSIGVLIPVSVAGASVYLLLNGGTTPLGIGALISAGILFVLAYVLPQKTQKGADIHRQLMGLKLYLSVAEKDRIAFHNAPEKTPQLFEKLLPYAMLFGVVDIWVKEFADIAKNPPSYYHATTGAWNAVAFASDVSHFSSSVALVSGASGSGGGGFSGGGGGGGGGGSW